MRIIQNPAAFCFGTDAVLLSHFVSVRKGDRIADLGTGTGIIPLLLCGHYPEEELQLVGLEIQPQMANMAMRSVLMNGLEERVHIVEGDLRVTDTLDGPKMGRQRFDVVTCNPPFRKLGSGTTSQASAVEIARHEVCCTLREVCAAAARLLRYRGRFAMIHQAGRLGEIFACMHAERLEPKRLQSIQAQADSAPKLVLVEAVYQGNPGIHWLAPRILSQNEAEF